MSRPAVTYPDAEVIVTDLLADLMEDYDATVTVGVVLPDGWNVDDSEAHVQVAWDGTPAVGMHPIAAGATIRIVAWSDSPARSKELAAAAQGLLAAWRGGSVGARGFVSTISPLTGVLPGRDPDHRADIASCTVRVVLRSIPLP